MSMIVHEIPLGEILRDDEFNCRGMIAPIDVADLVQSITKHGLLEPITVQPWDKVPGKKYRIVTGHRRFTAFKVSGRETIPAFIKENLSELEAKTLNLVENIQRRNLNLLQEAKAIEYYKRIGLTQEETADLTKLSRGWIQVRFMVLDFPEDIQKEIAAGFINQTQVRDLHGMTHDKAREVVHDIKLRRERGEQVPITYRPVKKKGSLKRERHRKDIVEMLESIYDILGPGFYTRALAWASGEISDLEFQVDIKNEAIKMGKIYNIPLEYMRS